MKKLIFIMLALLGMTQATAQEYDLIDYLPLVRDGVKWVNEKVIISHGDTTSYFYTYEVLGDVPYGQNEVYGDLKYCHYYTGDQIDDENDSIIALLREWSPRVLCIENLALDNVEANGRNLLERIYLGGLTGGELIYHFYHPFFSIAITDMYIPCQKEPSILTTDNLIEIEPIEIEGYQCPRLAYINEQGDTAAYVVEGIGFDSRNMGDLLTPFTKEPDPDADYQEYCGLCHVIKDGKIIYKGMRYSPDNMTGINETVADQRPRQYDDNYYNLMGQPVGKVLPTSHGIYIHHGKKVVIR